MSENLITLREAERLGYGHPNTLRKHIKSGALRARKVGNQFKVTQSALDEWAAFGLDFGRSPAEGQAPFPRTPTSSQRLVVSLPPFPLGLLNSRQMWP